MTPVKAITVWGTEVGVGLVTLVGDEVKLGRDKVAGTEVGGVNSVEMVLSTEGVIIPDGSNLTCGEHAVRITIIPITTKKNWNIFCNFVVTPYENSAGLYHSQPRTEITPML